MEEYNQDNYYDVGSFTDLGNGKYEVEKGYCSSGNDGLIFKSARNYDSDDNMLPVYQAEHQEGKTNYYTRKDFEDMTGNKKLAEQLFEEVDWQHPETRLMEWEEFEEDE